MYKPLPALPEEITPPSPSVMPTSDPLELPWDSLLFSNREAQACTDTKNDVNPVLYSSACILEVIPDVDPDHVTALITENIQECGAGVVERVLHTLFDDPRYPKIKKRGIMKKVSDGSTEEGSPPDKVNCGFRYDDRNRLFTGGPNYIDLAIEHLKDDFPLVPTDFLNASLHSFNDLYAPTHLFLLERYKKYGNGKQRTNIIKFPFRKNCLPFRSRSLPCPNKSKLGTSVRLLHDEEFSKERAWLMQEIMYRAGSGIQCGCCFATFRFNEMVQCPEAHLFCITCMTSYTSTLLGAHNSRIQCIDRSGCTALIPESELRRFLPETMVRLWESVSQRKAIMDAGLEGLEECPFCDYSVIIENEEEKLFKCRNEGVCGVVSCRACKKPDHLPIRCEDVEKDTILDGRHTIEEAMSRALVRNCPKCQKPFVKEFGCNVMTCPSPGCGAVFCYVCRQLIDGYNHVKSGPCSGALIVEVLHETDVKEAHQRALEEYKHDHPEIDEDHIKIDLPSAVSKLDSTVPLAPLGVYY